MNVLGSCRLLYLVLRQHWDVCAIGCNVGTIDVIYHRITMFEEGARELWNKPSGAVWNPLIFRWMKITIKCFSHFNFIFQVSIDGNDSVSGTGMIAENEQDKKMQVCSPIENN